MRTKAVLLVFLAVFATAVASATLLYPLTQNQKCQEKVDFSELHSTLTTNGEAPRFELTEEIDTPGIPG
jgi:hypothetical protein